MDDELEVAWQKSVVTNGPPSLIERYLREVSRFRGWLSARHIGLLTVNRDTIEQYVLEREPREAATVASIKSLFRFLLANSEIAVDPAEHIRWRKPVLQRKALDETSVHGFLDQLSPWHCADDFGPKQYFPRVRAWAMAELAYSSGMSTEELVKIGLKDTDLPRLSVTVDNRLVPITPRARTAISYWLLIRNALLDVPARFLFHGRGLPHAAMTQRPSADFRFFEIAGRRYTMVELRHAYIVHAADRGLSLANICRLTGLGVAQVESILKEYLIDAPGS
ncbi:site-specific integrase [Devosia crocina]|nr:hypothetical protein [Devosia crocina]